MDKVKRYCYPEAVWVSVEIGGRTYVRVHKVNAVREVKRFAGKVLYRGYVRAAKRVYYLTFIGDAGCGHIDDGRIEQQWVAESKEGKEVVMESVWKYERQQP
jgi:hypothetical protein